MRRSYRGSDPEESHQFVIFGNRGVSQISGLLEDVSRSRGLGVSGSRSLREDSLLTVAQASLPVIVPRGRCGAASLHDKSAFVLWNKAQQALKASRQ